MQFPTVIVEQLIQSGRGQDGLHLTLVTLLTVFAPETVHHHLGEGASTGGLLDLVGVELDAFLFQVVLNIPVTFVGIVPHPLGPSAGFLFDLEKCVDVGGEQLVGFVREVPDFVHVLNEVTLIDGFLQFRGGPGTHETALGLGVNAVVTAFDQQFGLLMFHTDTTKGNVSFPPWR